MREPCASSTGATAMAPRPSARPGGRRSQASAALKAEAVLALEAAERALAPASAETMGRWLASLGLLCAGAMAAQEARAKIGAYASLMDYPPACFTKATLARGGTALQMAAELCRAGGLPRRGRGTRARVARPARAPSPKRPCRRRRPRGARSAMRSARKSGAVPTPRSRASRPRPRPCAGVRALPPVHTRDGPFDPGRTPGEELRSAEVGNAIEGEGPWPGADA